MQTDTTVNQRYYKYSVNSHFSRSEYFHILNFPPLQQIEHICLQPTLLILYKGIVSIAINKGVSTMEYDRIYSIKENTRIDLYTITDSSLFIFQFDYPLKFSSFQIENHIKNCYFERIYQQYIPYYGITLKPELKHFVESLYYCMKYRVVRHDFVESRKLDLFSFLRAEYDNATLLDFFQPWLNTSDEFVEFANNNYMKMNSVEEFAENANMSLSKFKRTFQNCFNTSPGEWMRKKKTNDIYNDLRNSRESISDICYKYQFSSRANFNRFCKKFIGLPPSEIRNGLLSKQIELKK